MIRLLALGFCALTSIACKRDSSSQPPVKDDPAAAHIAKLKDGSTSERIAAARTLAGLGSGAKSAVSELERTLDDSDEKVRHEAALAMQAIAPENAAGRSGITLLRLKQIGKAMHDYLDAHNGVFPPTCTIINTRDGKPLPRPGLSWRVLLLPYLGEKELFEQFKLDEPWNSEHNRKLIARMPAVYAPAAGSPATKEGTTCMQAFTHVSFFGPGIGMSIFAHPMQMVLQKIPPCHINAIADGMSNTFLVVEAAKPVIWTRPEDVVVSDAPLPELGFCCEDRFHVCMADGAVLRLSRRAPAFQLRVSIGRADGMLNDLNAMAHYSARPPAKQTTPVLGRVMLKGAPLVVGWVVLHTEDGREYGGQLGVDGSFLVKDVPTGKVKATIAQGDPFAGWLDNPDGKLVFPKRLPVADKYGHPDSTPLQFEVKPDTKEINLALE